MYETELEVALLAVQRASILTKRVFLEKAKGATNKKDRTPVTIGDFGAQALLISALQARFPDDAIIAEEEAGMLREDAELRAQVWELVAQTHLAAGDGAGEEEEEARVLGGRVASEDAMLDLIDKGQAASARHGRTWVIDPIDGTKGFLAGEQYAVCLALLVDGHVQVGVLACPNLPHDASLARNLHLGSPDSQAAGTGILLSAVRGQGATSRPLTAGRLSPNVTPIRMREHITDATQAVFCQSARHSNIEALGRIRARLGVGDDASVSMDSQAKYGSIARGAGDIYLRLSVLDGYRECIWDHAPGVLIVEEAGGKVTDLYGKPLDFTLGRRLSDNIGTIATTTALHETVLAAVQHVLGEQ